MSSETDTGPLTERHIVRHTKRPSLLSRIGQLLSKAPKGELIEPSSTPLAVHGDVRVAWREQPFQLMLGGVALELHPDLAVTGNEGNEIDGVREWIIHPGSAFYETVPRFVRVSPGETLLLGRTDDTQTRMFGFDGSVANRHVNVSNRKGELVIQPLAPDRPTTISIVESPLAVWSARRKNLIHLPDVIGSSLTPLDQEEALNALLEVNDIVASEAYRALDDDGLPGGVIQFPDDMTVVILGDVHARADNVLRVITEGGLLAALERNEACLVLLGDLVHSQESDELEDMESTVLILDLFCMLKRRFPENIFYIRGNHESFSPEVGKGGVPQGLLLQKHLKKLRGKAYVKQVERLFDGLAFVVLGNEFAACHGAPVRSTVDLDVLINIRRYPGIQSEVIWDRLRQGNRPGGYTKGSVKRFRRTLGLSKHAPFFVGHTPQSSKETLWLDVGGIKGHHIVYSAHTHRAAAIVMSGGQMTPLEFVPEQALAFLNNRADA